MAKFGKLIHKYTIKDSAIVPLIYEGRFVDQKADEENNDLWFKQTTKRLTDAQKEDLRKKWSSIRRLTSTDARIKRIALDISEHFTEGYKNTGFKAMLATNYILSWVKTWVNAQTQKIYIKKTKLQTCETKEKVQKPHSFWTNFGCGGRTRTYDLRVMSPTSFQLLYSAI